MIYRYVWLDRFMKRWFLKKYFKKYMKLYPQNYLTFDLDGTNNTYCMNVTNILGAYTNHKDSKIKKVLDSIIGKQIISNNDFSNTTTNWGDENNNEISEH